jgi:hypothetical protein
MVEGEGCSPQVHSGRRAKAAAEAGTTASTLVLWSVHDLRRTVATGLQRLGVRLEVTEAVLNRISGTRWHRGRLLASALGEEKRMEIASPSVRAARRSGLGLPRKQKRNSGNRQDHADDGEGIAKAHDEGLVLDGVAATIA